MKRFVMGIDLGTTGTKAIIFDRNSKIYGVGYQEYLVSTPEPGWYEFHAEELISQTFAACRDALQRAQIDAEEIEAISFSTQRSTFGFVDENDKVLENLLYSWQDIRASEEVAYMKDIVSPEEMTAISGMPVTETYVISKMLWVRNHKPEVFQRAKKMVLISDLLMKRFGSTEYFCDWGNASCVGVFDIHSRQWSKYLLDKFDMPLSLFVKPIQAGELIGYVSADAARQTGLSTGTKLISGSGDQSCGAFGAGVVRDGVAELTIGTAGHLISYLKEPLRSKEALTMMTVNSAQPGQYELNGIQLSAAVIYRWFRDNCAALEKEQGKAQNVDPYVLINQKAEQSPAGANGLVLLPYFAAAGSPHWNVEATGMLLGLTLKHTQGDVARAFMEGCVYEIRDMLETMRSAGANFTELSITGGATRSDLWCHIISDILNIPVKRLVVSDATVLGAAMIAAVGAGWFDSFTDAADSMVKWDERIEPNPEHVAIYEQSYAVFQNAYQALNGGKIFHQLAHLREISRN